MISGIVGNLIRFLLLDTGDGYLKSVRPANDMGNFPVGDDEDVLVQCFPIPAP